MFDENEKGIGQKPSLEETLSTLQLAEDEVIPAKAYYGLSGLDDAEIEKVKPVWNKLSADFRRKLLLQFAESAETNVELEYHNLGLLALEDEDRGVRLAAVEVLALDESLELLRRLIDLSQADEDYEVRAAVTSALGQFILLGEYEDIPEKDAVSAQDAAISILMNEQEAIEVRRRALEAISNSSHEILPEVIREAYESPERLMQVSSLFAMGRSCDRTWRDIVLKELDNEDEEIRYEAARATGELLLEEAVSRLGEIATLDEREIAEAAIWSLGEIGGREALRFLSELAQTAEEMDDDTLLEAVEDAISSASLVGESIGFDPDDD